MMIFGRHGARAALACAAFMVSITAAAGEDVSRALTRLRDVDARIVETTRSVEATHAASRGTEPRDAARVGALRRGFDAVVRDAASGGYVDEPAFARKRAAVERLLANLERARDTDAGAALPALMPALPSTAQLARVAADSRAGRDCAHALLLGPDRAVETTLAAAGTPGATLWLRFTPATAEFNRIDTFASALDTDIAVYGAECPAGDAAPLARGDDEFGLAASVSLDARKDASARIVRVRNLGAAGDAVIRGSTGAAISGRVTDARNGAPVQTFVSALLVGTGFYGPSASSDASGFYLLTVDPGSYYVAANYPYSYNQTYMPEAYPDIECGPIFGGSGCDFDAATVFALGDGDQQPNVDFALGIGARISGTVRERISGAPVAGAIVAVYDGQSQDTSSTATDAAGRYIVPYLLAGTYRATAAATGYGSELWSHIDCGDDPFNPCDPTAGTPIPVARDTLVTGIDFDLPLATGAQVAVTLPAGMPDAYWEVVAYDSGGNIAGYYSGYGSSGGLIALAPGSYRFALTGFGIFGQVWSGIDCPTDCLQQLGQGTVVTLASSQQATLSFAPRQVPTISGTVTGTAGGPLSGIQVYAISVDDGGNWVYGYTDTAGRYTLQPGGAGSFYVIAYDPAYRGEIYPSGRCTGATITACDLTDAIALPIAFGGSAVTGVDFALALNGTVSGHIAFRTPDGLAIDPIPLGYGSVVLSDGAGSSVGNSSVDSDGNYTVTDVPEGNWYAVAQTNGFAQLWQGIDCGFSSGCNYTTGTPVAVGQGEHVTGIDFDPVPQGYVFGHASDASGMPVAGVAIDLWSTTDGSHCGVGVTNASGDYAAQATGSCYNGYYVSTDAPAGYENEVFDGIVCPDGPAFLGFCDPTRGTVVPVPTMPTFPIADFVFGPYTDTLFIGTFDP